MSKVKDITGQQFGDFIIDSFDPTKGKYKYYWNCHCVKWVIKNRQKEAALKPETAQDVSAISLLDEEKFSDMKRIYLEKFMAA